MQFAVVFSCLVLSLTFMQDGVGAVQCGQIECGIGAVCVSGQCQCPAGFNGNGRSFCAQNRCVCGGHGDTIYSLFDSLTLKVNLPCSVDLVKPTSGSFPNIGNCIYNYITANPMVRPGGSKPNDPPFRTFVASLEFSGIKPPFTIITASVDSVTGTVSPASEGTVANVTDPTFQRVTVTGCSGLDLGFAGPYGTAFVALPNVVVPSGMLSGICGNCNNQTDVETIATPGSAVAYYLRNLAPFERQKGPLVTACQAVANQTLSTDCTDAELLNAGNICGRYLGAFGKCVRDDSNNANINNDETLLTFFGACVAAACAGQSTTALCNLLVSQQTTGCPLGTCP